MSETTNAWVEIVTALLDWPVLLTALIVFCVYRFQDRIGALLERGDIHVVWGNKQVRLKELSQEVEKDFDQTFDELIGQIEANKAEIARLRALVEPADAAAAASAREQANVHDLPDPAAVDPAAAVETKIIQALQNHTYRWRSVERVAAVAGISYGEAERLLEQNSDVVLSIGKSGRRIARLRHR